MRIRTPKLLISIAIPLFAAFLGSVFTTGAVNNWYLILNKPAWNPPSWLFGPVWTVLFVLMGIALYLVWSAKSSKNVREAIKIFVAQLLFNVLWSAIFFGTGGFWFAFGEILVLWTLILATIFAFRKVNRAAAWLLVPYLLWVTFASYLNLTIARLN